MSTAFYTRRNLTSQQKDDLKSLVDREDWHDLFEKANQYKEISIHELGHLSYGWQFIWEYDFKFGVTLDSIKEYLYKLEEEGGWIEDEYDTRYTVDQFFEKIQNSLYLDKKHRNIHTHCENDPPKYGETHIQYHITIGDDIIPVTKYGEFQANGLRFRDNTYHS